MSAATGTAGHSTVFDRTDIIIGVAGVLQLCVAVYAIRLNRLFGAGQVGWSLFSAFLLLALLHLIQSFSQPHVVNGFQVDLEVVYALISLLLLTGMAHLHTVLREQQHTMGEQERRKVLEQQLRVELESEVQKKTAFLNHAVETLKLEIEVRKRAEAQIGAQARLLDLAHDAIVVQDLEGRVKYWNEGAHNIYGWTAQEAAGNKICDLVSHELLKYEDAVKAVQETGRWEGEVSTRTKAGQKVLVEEDWTLVRDARGNPESIMVISADVSEKRALETQTLRLQRLESIGTLAGGIAHDLNNVLTPLLLSVELLRDKINTEDERELLDALKSNALRGARLVKQILTFGRGVKGDRVIVKPAKLVQEIRQLVLDTFPKSLEFELRVAEDLWPVTGDATQLYQVLLNLCVNARDAMPKGGRLSIQMENVMLDDSYVGRNLEAKPGPYVLIKVTDNGSGIPKSIQNRIFEPFFTTKEHGKGTGLGLSTSFTIVKNHGGFINCYSEPGNGTAFKVYLPAEAGVTAMEQKPAEPASLPQGRGELVMIVDDEQVIREFAQITLECFGYRTVTAADGAEAVSVYKSRQHEIAIVLMDMWMPVMDGPSAIEALKAINDRVLVIGTSGLGGIAGEKVEKCLSHFIPKPYTTDSLLHGLRAVLERPITVAPRPALTHSGVVEILPEHPFENSTATTSPARI